MDRTKKPTQNARIRSTSNNLVRPKPAEETKLQKPQLKPILNKATIQPNPGRVTKVVKKDSNLEDLNTLKEKIKNNSNILTELKNVFQANNRKLVELKSQRKLISSQDQFESLLIQSFLMDEELEAMLNQTYQEPEYTYEELLELGDRIGNVSKGLSEDQINNLKIIPVEKPTDCSICLIQISKSASATILHPCTHIYHFDCIKTWLSEHKTCPLCLQEIEC